MLGDADGKVNATVTLAVAGHELTVEMRLPTRPTRPGELLPLYRGLAEQLVQAGVARVEEAGRTVSCRKGCGACCRQLVPVSELEARRIREVIEEMPPERRAAVRERFADARRRLAETGLLPLLQDPSLLPPGEASGFGLRYFVQGVACPFLEDESCSIYQERPIACREYLVTSPAANCAYPTPETIASVPVLGWVSRAVRWLSTLPDVEQPPWVPLILAPAWADTHPEPPATRTGPELVRALFERLSGDEVPEAGRASPA